MDEPTINADITISGNDQSLLANRYRVVRQLGQGGMGSVWLAEDTVLDNRQVAIKMLPSILVANQMAYRQLKAEALMSMKLSHSNIASVRSFEENGGNPFLVEDYIEGQTLDGVIAGAGGRLSEEETMRLLRPIAAALDYAHSEKVIHRDIKPGNILVRKDGKPFILDFGVAREVQETMTKTTGQTPSGTIMYMSPDQLSGAQPSAAQDVYSFAAMAYECLTGAPPFSRGAIEDQIRHKQPEPLQNRSYFSRSVVWALAKDPKARPKSCQAIFPSPSSSVQAAYASSLTASSHDSVAVQRLEVKALLFVERLKRIMLKGVPEFVRFQQSVSSEFESGQKALREGALESAERKYSAVLIDEARLRPLATRIAKQAFNEQKWEEAFEALKESDGEDAELLFAQGQCYAVGNGVAISLERAYDCFSRAAEKGHAAALFNQAMMLEKGQGCESDPIRAIEMYEKMAEAGSVGAKRRLGEYYLGKREGVKDEQAAFSWLKQAGDSEDVPSLILLGECYARGLGCKQDLEEAVACFSRAKEMGSDDAAERLVRFQMEIARKTEQKPRARKQGAYAEASRRNECVPKRGGQNTAGTLRDARKNSTLGGGWRAIEASSLGAQVEAPRARRSAASLFWSVSAAVVVLAMLVVVAVVREPSDVAREIESVRPAEKKSGAALSQGVGGCDRPSVTRSTDEAAEKAALAAEKAALAAEKAALAAKKTALEEWRARQQKQAAETERRLEAERLKLEQERRDEEMRRKAKQEAERLKLEQERRDEEMRRKAERERKANEESDRKAAQDRKVLEDALRAAQERHAAAIKRDKADLENCLLKAEAAWEARDWALCKTMVDRALSLSPENSEALALRNDVQEMIEAVQKKQEPARARQATKPEEYYQQAENWMNSLGPTHRKKVKDLYDKGRAIGGARIDVIEDWLNSLK